MSNFKVTERTVESLCSKATMGMRQVLSRTLVPPISRNGIMSHLGFLIAKRTDRITFETQLPDYAVYVDRGRRPGKQPPVKSLVAWCVQHGMRGAEFAIARNIGKHGIRPTNFTTPLQRMLSLLNGALKQSIAVDVNNEVNKIVEKTKTDIKIEL